MTAIAKVFRRRACPDGTIAALAASLLAALVIGFAPEARAADTDWTRIADGAPWGGRAGLQVVELEGDLYLLGGRTPKPPGFPPIPGDSEIWGDVWRSRDGGLTWTRILETDDTAHWPARAYFQAVTDGRALYVVGGQNYRVVPNPNCAPPFDGCLPFLSVSDFFSDVWRSEDGVRWQRLTGDAGWAGRAGLSAVYFKGAFYVLAGSQNDDDAVIGGPPQRIYFNDVWRSEDGRQWHRVTEHAPWAPRAGAAVVVKNGWLYLLGGEAGFLCQPQPCQLPYFNDVWRTRDGETWEQVTPAAAWSPRPGHVVAVVRNTMYLFGGFGPFGNPVDVWASEDGAAWRQLAGAPWNAVGSDDIRYDFDVVPFEGKGRTEPALLTFGGDRETFDFTDPTNYLRVEDDVWRFTPPPPSQEDRHAHHAAPVTAAAPAAPTVAGRTDGPAQGLEVRALPHAGNAEIRFVLAATARVELAVFDVAGRRVAELLDATMDGGSHAVTWSPAGRSIGTGASTRGVYFVQMRVDGVAVASRRMVVL